MRKRAFQQYLFFFILLYSSLSNILNVNCTCVLLKVKVFFEQHCSFLVTRASFLRLKLSRGTIIAAIIGERKLAYLKKSTLKIDFPILFLSRDIFRKFIIIHFKKIVVTEKKFEEKKHKKPDYLF